MSYKKFGEKFFFITKSEFSPTDDKVSNALRVSVVKQWGLLERVLHPALDSVLLGDQWGRNDRARLQYCYLKVRYFKYIS